MDIILDVDGWTKVISISTGTHNRGRVRIAVPRPLSFTVTPEHARISEVQIAIADFYRTRQHINGMPVYKEEHTR